MSVGTDAGRVPGVARLLVLRANGLGDLIVAEPALQALRAAYPDAEVVLAGSAWAGALLAGRPFPVDRVVAAPLVTGVRVASDVPDDPPDVVEAFCAARRAERYDLAVQLHGGGGNANPLLRRFGARLTAGSRAPGAGSLDRTVPWTPFQHDVLRWLEVVALVGAPPVRLQPHLAVMPADLAAADAALAGAGLAGTGAWTLREGPPLVVLHPGASDARRRWPPERLGEVGRALLADGARVLVLGGDADAEAVGQVLAAAGPGATELHARLDVPGLVGVLARADLFVGNDSGPRHLAEAVGTATVAVFTRANLVDVAPLFRARQRVLVSWASRCATCGAQYQDGDCGHGDTVLADIPAADVLAQARDLLGASVAPAALLPRG